MLINQGLWMAGVREMHRFVSLCDSSEYRELLSEQFLREVRKLDVIGVDAVYEVAREAQQILARRN